MTLANSVYQKHGALVLPLNPDDFTDGLAPLDPARTTLTELFKAAINAELGEVWAKLFKSPLYAGGLPAEHPLRDSDPVNDTLELEPSGQVLKQYKATFPLLCVHRSGTGTHDQVTLQEDRLVQQWLVHYILCPLDVGDIRKFVDACVAVAKIVRATIRDRGHKAYQNGALQFFPDGGGALASVELKSQEGPGAAQFGGEGAPIYYAIVLTLETVERLEDRADQYDEAKGVDLEVGVGSQDEILPGLIYASSDDPYQYG